MASTTQEHGEPLAPAKTHWWAMCLMIGATVLTSGGLVSLKFASDALDWSFAGTVANWPLWLGLGLYVCAAGLMIIAFSGGELSVLDPLQSACFIWTMLAAWWILDEHISLHNVGGIGIILAGIVLLTSGRGGAENESA